MDGVEMTTKNSGPARFAFARSTNKYNGVSVIRMTIVEALHSPSDKGVWGRAPALQVFS